MHGAGRGGEGWGGERGSRPTPPSGNFSVDHGFTFKEERNPETSLPQSLAFPLQCLIEIKLTFELIAICRRFH